MSQTALLLDRAVVLQVGLPQNGRWISTLLPLLAPYGQLLYEPAGLSGIEGLLHSMGDIAPRLVAIPPDTDFDLKSDESLRLSSAIKFLATRPPILHSIHQLTLRSVNPQPMTEILGYAMRLFLLSHRFKSDIISSQERSELLRSVLQETDTHYSVSPKNDDVRTEIRASNVYQIWSAGQVSNASVVSILSVNMPDARIYGHGLKDSASPSPKHDAAMTEGGEVFVSYSHKDVRWLKKLEVHLTPLLRHERLNVWSDTKIPDGANWQQEIDSALGRSKIAILLVTPNFLASEFIVNCELPRLLNAAAGNKLLLMWIPISASAYQITALSDIQAAWKPDRPLDSLSPAAQSRAFVEICLRIQHLQRS